MAGKASAECRKVPAWDRDTPSKVQRNREYPPWKTGNLPFNKRRKRQADRVSLASRIAWTTIENCLLRWQRWRNEGEAMKLVTCIAALAISTSAAALDIRGFEAMMSQRASSDLEEARAARLMLTAYFAGVAELLATQSAPSQAIYFHGKKAACFPRSATFSGPVFMALVESELRDPTKIREVLGSDWRTYSVTTVLFFSLLKNYPCAE